MQVNTQVATSHGRFIDLEVLLRPAVGAPERGLLIWVEVKHGADLHGDQLDVYLQDIPMRPVPEDVERVVVLLGPRGWTPTAGVLPTEVLVANWQAVGKTVETVETGTRPPEQNWLLSEYVRYLKEEGLSDPDALTTVSALALMEHKTAEVAAAGICEYTDGVVQAEWGTRGSHKKTSGNTPSPAFGIGYWANYDAHREGQAHPNWREAWFEWGLRDTGQMEGLEDVRGSRAFMAGATLITNDNPTKVADNQQWLAQHLANGFKYFWIAGYWRLARLRYPDELLRDMTLDDQGRGLGRWILETFRELADRPPLA